VVAASRNQFTLRYAPR